MLKLHTTKKLHDCCEKHNTMSLLFVLTDKIESLQKFMTKNQSDKNIQALLEFLEHSSTKLKLFT